MHQRHFLTSHTPISKEAAYLSLHALHTLPINTQSIPLAPFIAWNSGTSFGHLDSWALDVSDRFVVGVWGGNFANQSSLELTGREIAGVLMYDIFGLLLKDEREFGKWHEVGRWSNTPKMREVFVDEHGYRVAPHMGHKALMGAFALPLRTLPSTLYAPSLITYPTQGLRIQYPTSKHNQQLVGIMQTKEKTYCFLNGAFVGVSENGRIALRATSGWNMFYIITASGQSASVMFEILD